MHFPSFFMNYLRVADNMINELIREFTTDFKLSSLLLLSLISFLYGVAHSIGPGHGKSLVATFFLKEKHPVVRSVVLSFIISVIHTGSALVLSFLLFYVLTGIKGMFRIKLQSYFMTASGLMILALGILFFIFKLIGHNHEDSNADNTYKSSNGIKNIVLVGISAGIVPCPASLMIMLFALSNNIIVIGLFSVLSISLGMFVLLSVIGAITIYSRNAFVTLSGKFQKNTEKIASIIEYISIMMIICIGFFMSSGFFKSLFS